MLPGMLDNQAGRAWQAFFDVMQAGARAAHEFGAANLPMPLPLRQLLGMDDGDAADEFAARMSSAQAPQPMPAGSPTQQGAVANQSIRERFPIGSTIQAFGKFGKVTGYNDHPNGTHVLADLGSGTPASFDPLNPP